MPATGRFAVTAAGTATDPLTLTVLRYAAVNIIQVHDETFYFLNLTEMAGV
jgi:hypothetical protein